MWETRSKNTSSTFDTDVYDVCCSGDPIDDCRCQDEWELAHFKMVLLGPLVTITVLGFAIGMIYLFSDRK